MRLPHILDISCLSRSQILALSVNKFSLKNLPDEKKLILYSSYKETLNLFGKDIAEKRLAGAQHHHINLARKILKKKFFHQNFICFLCNTPILKTECTIEHIVSRSEGGRAYNNLTFTHLTCNSGRETKGK